MRILVQRSLNSSVSVDGKVIGSIDRGLVLLVGFTEGDNSLDIDYIVKKIVNLRVFDDENGVMNKSILDTNGSILSMKFSCISLSFTLIVTLYPRVLFLLNSVIDVTVIFFKLALVIILIILLSVSLV